MDRGNFYFTYLIESELKPKKTIMEKLSIYAKRLLDPDLQLLIKAGILDADLSLTRKGVDLTNAFFLEKYKTEFVAFAKSEIEDEKN